MSSKSISHQIYDEFVERLTNSKVLKDETIAALKRVIEKGNVKKQHIVQVLEKEEEGHEDT